MSAAVGLVLVSHSGNLAKGTAEVAAQMAPDVPIYAAGGTEDNRIGTSFDRVRTMIERVRADGARVVILADLGSALLTAESVAEIDGEDDVTVVDVPFVEGAVVAAVAAQTGSGVEGVVAAARSAIDAFPGGGKTPAVPVDTAAPAAAGGVGGSGAGEGEAVSGSGELTRIVTLGNSLGLHARPAAQVARMVAEYDAEVTINDTPADSLLALMGLGLPGGAEVRICAGGAQAQEILEKLAAEFENGFGEE